MEDETIMTSIFGNSPQVKLLDLLVVGKGMSYSITDMAEYAGIGRSSVYRMLDDMIANNIVVQTKRIGRIRLFSINDKNPTIQAMIAFINKAAKIASEREIARQVIKVKH